MISHHSITKAGFLAVLLLCLVSVAFADEEIGAKLRGTKNITPAVPGRTIKRGPEKPVIIPPGRKLATSAVVPASTYSSRHSGTARKRNKRSGPHKRHRRSDTPRKGNRRPGTPRKRHRSSGAPRKGNWRSGHKRPPSSDRWFGFDGDGAIDGLGELGEWFEGNEGGDFPFEVGDILEFGNLSCTWIMDDELGWVCDLVEDFTDTLEDEFGN